MTATAAVVDEYADLRRLLAMTHTEIVAGKTLEIAPFAFERLPEMVNLVGQAKAYIRLGRDALEIDTHSASCGQRLSSCRCRFGATAPIDFMGFPAAGLLR